MPRACPVCGYDLSGHAAGVEVVCPECGAACPAAGMHRIRPGTWVASAAIPTAGAGVLHLVILAFESPDAFNAEMNPTVLVLECLFLLAIALGPPVALARAYGKGCVKRHAGATILFGGWALSLAIFAAIYGLSLAIISLRGL